MIIRYTGLKPRKVVNIAGKEYVFEPTYEFNEVFDLVQIKWLLHPERAGLFVVEKTSDRTPSASQPELSQPKEQTSRKEPEKKPSNSKTKKRGSKPKKKR